MFSTKMFQHLYSVSCLDGFLSDGTNQGTTCSNQYSAALQSHDPKPGAVCHHLTNMGDAVLQDKKLAHIFLKLIK